MIALELACAAIVAIYVFARRGALPELGLLAVAGFLGEDSVIRAYGFYSYSPRWHLFIDRVPLMIALIWPIVIHSAWSLGRRFSPAGGWAPLIGAGIVLADASLIEPIAVHAGLWTWTEPGLFAVPPIGIVGWAFFAGAAMVCLERARPVAAVIFAPLVTHVLLVASWWLVFKWLSRPLPAWPFVAGAWLVLGALALAAARLRPGRGQPAFRKDLLLRGPGAAFFFVLLVLHARDLPSLCVYSVAFAPPYLALLLG
jgi:carotenoid biosynthesis protein